MGPPPQQIAAVESARTLCRIADGPSVHRPKKMVVAGCMATRRRRFAALGATLVLVGILTIVAAAFAGPLSSGALFLLLATGIPPMQHDLPDCFEPVHKGGVDLATGLYVRRDEDLVLKGTPSFVLRRAYLSGDRVSRQFGVGATSNAEWYLIGDPAAFQWIELILEDGARIHFSRVSKGTSCATALLEHHSTPSGFDGARLGWTGLGWAMRLQDGSLALFRPCGSDQRPCALTRLRDFDGHSVAFRRDAQDLLRSIDTPRERISLRYDSHRRVSMASDSSGHRVDYAYDEAGRLVRVTYSDGVVRSYAYDARDRMVLIDEPGRIIENGYDSDNHLVRQVVHRRPQSNPARAQAVSTFEVTYRVDRGVVVEANVTEDGALTRLEFNASHYVLRRTFNPNTATPITVTFDRNPSNNVARAFTVACTNRFGATTHTFDIGFESEQEAVSRSVARLCGFRRAAE